MYNFMCDLQTSKEYIVKFAYSFRSFRHCWEINVEEHDQRIEKVRFPIVIHFISMCFFFIPMRSVSEAIHPEVHAQYPQANSHWLVDRFWCILSPFYSSLSILVYVYISLSVYSFEFAPFSACVLPFILFEWHELKFICMNLLTFPFALLLYIRDRHG